MKKPSISDHYDVIIAGGGAGGIAAALWCAELNLKSLLLERETQLGGQLLWTYNKIENHLGIETKNGREMRDVFVRQLERRDFTLRLGSVIAEADLREKKFALESGERFSADAIIVATGVERRRLNIKGEKEFRGKGIIGSGKRDQDLAAGTRAAVVGGGDAAFENALILAETALKVSLIHRGASFRARSEFIEPATKNRKIEIITETVVEEIIGDARVNAIKLKNPVTGEKRILPVETLLTRIGVAPNTELFRGQLELDENGYIKINHNCATQVPGVFAVGDVANPLAPTVSGAVGTGAIAAKASAALLAR